jgi:hypothetical protein
MDAVVCRSVPEWAVPLIPLITPKFRAGQSEEPSGVRGQSVAGLGGRRNPDEALVKVARARQNHRVVHMTGVDVDLEALVKVPGLVRAMYASEVGKCKTLPGPNGPSEHVHRPLPVTLTLMHNVTPLGSAKDRSSPHLLTKHLVVNF